MLAVAALFALAGALALPAQAQTLPTLSVSTPAAVTEGGDVTFTVTLAPASTEDVTVNWATGSFSTNTATSDVDYIGDAGILTFSPGEVTKTVTAETIDDQLDEEDAETFTLSLSFPNNATLEGGGSRTTGTINDNDEQPSVTVGNAMADEGGNAVFTVTLSAVSGRDVTVNYATADGSAAAGSDYTAANGILTIAAGIPTGTVEVTTLTDDDSSESEETFTLTLTNPSNATLGTNFTGTGRIRNLAPPAAPTGLSATAGNRYVTLAWNAPASGAVITHHEYRYKTDSDYQDNWKTIPHSATGGFNEDGFTVTKLANDTAHTFQLHAVNDDGVSAAVESSAVTPSGSGRIVESITMRRYDGQDGHPYGVGDEMVFVVKFSQNIRCADATSLKVRFNLGSATKEASSYAGAGTDTWWYRYTVQEDDVDSDGIEIPAGSQALPDRYYSDNGCNNVFDESGIKAQGPFPDRKVDGVYPSLDSAAVNGAELVLIWNETLRDDSVPAAGDFAITVAGSSRTVSSVAIAGSAVTLTLASAVTAGQIVAASYTKGTNPLKDLASNDAPGLTGQSVTNNTQDRTPPEITAVQVVASGLLVDFDFSEDHDLPAPIPQALTDAFSVTVDGAARPITSASREGNAGMSLAVSPKIYQGQTVTVSYDQSAAGADALDDADGNKLASFEDLAVLNNSTQVVPAMPTGILATAGRGSVTLRWDAPASDADITRHEYRYKTDGSYPADWTPIPDSAPGGANAARYRVRGLTSDTAYTFELRAVNDGDAGDAAETDPVTPTAALPPNPQTTNFYLWRTTLTVGESSGRLGYDKSDSLGSISTDADFGYPPWNPPHKHHVDRESYYTVEAITYDVFEGNTILGVYIDDVGEIAVGPGNVTLWLNHKSVELRTTSLLPNGNTIEFSSSLNWVPELDWAANDEISVALVYERRLPSKPTNVLVTAPPGEDGTLDVSWEEPEFGGTFPIECYLVEFGHPSGEAKKRRQSYPGSLGPGKGCGDTLQTSVRRTDLEADTEYQVMVQALSGDGFSEWSETKTVSTGRSLRAWFESQPERHDGKKRVTVQVAFSEAIDGTPETVGEHGVDVDGGRVTSVRPVGGDAPGGAGNRSAGGRDAGREDREVVWEFEIEPDSDGDVTVSLDAGRPCDEPGAICTADGRSLSEGISTTVEGPDTGPAGLTAAFEGMPESHDGEGGFRFRVAFSENIGIGFRSLREDAFTVTGGRVTGGRRVDGRRDLFEMTVRPDGDGDVTIALPAGRECGVSGAICTKSTPRRQLTNTPAATVAGPGAAALTARFVDMPAEHDGESAFTLRLAFSEAIRMSGRRLRGDVVAVAGGRATKAGRVNRRKDLWKLTVEPDSLADVTVTLSSGAACGTPEAVCTADGRALSNTISTTILGPVAVSVADARAEEGTDETIDFAVSLSRETHASVTVDYTTADGSATAGEDYTRTSGTLSFAAGETEKTVAVPVLDDAVDEGEETFTLRLSDATGARIADGVATGTIENSDPLQKMWLSRFGRTVAGQVVDAVAGRLSGPTGGSRVTLGGQSIDLSSLSADSVDARRTLAGALGAAQDDDPLAGPGPLEAARAGSWDDPETGGTVRGLTGRDLLLGSSFHLAAGGGEAGGPGYAAWGRVAVGGFDAEAPAEKGTVRLDGEVTTGILGADAQWERWLAGVALSVSEGEGSFDQPGVDTGTVESSLTSVNPYVRYEASDRLSVWGLFGYGTGDMTLTQAANDNRDRIVTRTDISMRLGAAGARGVLLKAGEDGGIDLALRGDAFLVQMDWEKVSNETDTGADASRLRLLLEAGRPFLLGPSAVLTPALELGLRHDGGDAETGAGVELGGRIRYTDTSSGLTVEANARTLVAHEDSGYEEWGAGGSVRLDPGASGRGLSLSLAPVWGTPSSGVERLWSARDAAGLVRDDDFEATRRLEGEIGYGFGAFGERGVVTPYAGLGLAEAGDRTWRAGARWSLAPHLAMSLDGARREPANDDAPEHTAQFRLTLRW